MQKEEILKKFRKFTSECKKQGVYPSRDRFNQYVPSRQIRNHFGNFFNLVQEFSNGKIVEVSAPSKPKKCQANKSFFKDNENGSAESESFGSKIKTLDQLIKECNIDLDKWEIEKHVINKWEQSSKVGDEIVTVPLFQVKAWLKQKVDEKAVKSLAALFEDEIKKAPTKKFKYEKPVENGKLLVLNLQDWHLGKTSTSNETGWSDYNVDVAKAAYKQAIKNILNNSPINQIQKVMLICGSDMIHFENARVETTSGTRIESGYTWHEVYNEACSFLSEIVEELASKFEVEVMMIYGNHARLTEYALGSYISAFFRNHPNVTVDNRPLNRKYYGYKKSLIGLTHSDKIKLTDLPLIMMRENQSTVSKYNQFFMLCGHTHAEKVIDIKGVRVMVCPALCPPDKFHVDHGYIGNVQAGQGLIFGESGLQQIVYS